MTQKTLLTVLELDGDGGIFLNLLLYLNHGEVNCLLKLCKVIIQREKAFSTSQLNHLWSSIAMFNSPSPRILQTITVQMETLLTNNGQISNEDIITPTSQRAIVPWTLSQRLYAMKNLHHLRWDRIIYESEACPRISRMEGHAIAHLSSADGDWAVVIDGWGSNSSNEAYVIDGTTLDVENKTVRTIPTTTVNNPRFRYGFSAICTTDNNRVLVFGGCSMGGYSGDCADLYIISLDFHRNQALEVCSVTASYSGRLPVASGSTPMTRGYHTANSVILNGEEHMLVFGGLHRRAPTNSMEVYNIGKNMWTTEDLLGVTGRPPSPRFGHTSVYDLRSDSFIITGGSDGNDLWRNGRELKDVYVLSIIRSKSEGGELSDSFVWSVPNLWGTSLNKQLPGRCHCANIVGSKMIYFGGGGRNHSSDVFVMDMSPPEEKFQDARLLQQESDSNTSLSTSSARAPRNFLLYKPTVYSYQRTPPQQQSTSSAVATTDGDGYRLTHFPIPISRCSAVSVQFGRCLFYFGGWNHSRSELNDIWSLDLTYSGSEEFAVSRSLGERGNVDVSGLKRDHTYEDGEEQDEYHEEEDDGEEEDDDDDDDDYDGGGGNSNRVPATFITAFLAAQGYTSNALASFLMNNIATDYDEDAADNAMEEIEECDEDDDDNDEDDDDGIYDESHDANDGSGSAAQEAVEDVRDEDEDEDDDSNGI